MTSMTPSNGAHEQQLLGDLRKLQARTATGKLKSTAKIQEAIWLLKERYLRVSRHETLEYEAAAAAVNWREHPERKVVAIRLDGGYLLKTDRQELSEEEIWRACTWAAVLCSDAPRRRTRREAQSGWVAGCNAIGESPHSDRYAVQSPFARRPLNPRDQGASA